MNGSFSADRIRGETGSNKTNSRTNGESPHGGLWEENKMKKVLAAIAAVMILASLGTMSVSAAGRGYGAGNGMGGGRGWQSTSTGIVTGGHHGNYIDANGDGVCDNWGTDAGGNGGSFVDANGDGICDDYGTGSCGGWRYVDANGDGVCDNVGTGSCGRWARSISER